MLKTSILTLILCVSALYFHVLYAQSFQSFYGNGQLKQDVRKLEDSSVMIIIYYRNGNVKDSSGIFESGMPGESIGYYKNGGVKFLSTLEQGDSVRITTEYRKDGSVKYKGSYIDGEEFGIHQAINRRGEIVRQEDYNKSRLVKIPREHKKSRRLPPRYAEKISYSNMVLTMGKKNLRIKAGTMISVALKDGNLQHHLLVEGFSSTSLVASLFDYDRSGNDSLTLKLLEAVIIPFNDISSVYFSGNNWHLVNTTATALNFLAAAFVSSQLFAYALEPNGGLEYIPLIEKPNPWLIVASPLLVAGSHSLRKKLVPRKLDLEKWQINLIK